MFVVGAVVLAVVAVAIFGSGRMFRQTYKFVVYFDTSVNGLNVGAPVKFKGVEIGSVAEIALNLTGAERSLETARIPVIIELDQDRITGMGGHVNLGDPAVVDELIKQGLRARLETQSFVTGVLYVALEVDPGVPVKLVNAPGVKYRELPTMPTTLEQVRSAAGELVDKLKQIDFERLVNSATEAVEGLGEITNSPKVKSAAESLDPAMQKLQATMESIKGLAENLNAKLGPAGEDLDTTSKEARVALSELAVTLNALRTVIEPESPTMYKLNRTLDELAAAARGVQALTDYLERNPGALLRGKETGEEKQ